MAERFYVDRPLALGPLMLRGTEVHHLVNVCRVDRGSGIFLFNGDGQQYRAVVEGVGKKEVLLRIEEIEAPDREISYRLELAAPLPRGDRAQFLVEKLTEIGVTHFVPLHTARSVVQPRPTHLDKLRRHVIEASKQCGRNVLMQVAPLTDWKTYVPAAGLPEKRILADPSAEEVWPPQVVPFLQGLKMAVGPEGGFTEEELALAQEEGWQKVSLGPRILRVETAALVLATLAIFQQTEQASR
jgi:16S rRNA (uracil1498-N3)-methyltransferase